MLEFMDSLFKRTKVMENQVEEFLDKIAEGGLILVELLRTYSNAGANDVFSTKLANLNVLESRCDYLKRKLEFKMFNESLMPDLRVDVMSLLSALDELLDGCKEAATTFAIETPIIPQDVMHEFVGLANNVASCVDAAVLASRAYFNSPSEVRHHVAKASHFESEADKCAYRIAQTVFSSNLPLENKRQLRSLVQQIDAIADAAEDIGDDLTIFAVKSSL